GSRELVGLTEGVHGLPARLPALQELPPVLLLGGVASPVRHGWSPQATAILPHSARRTSPDAHAFQLRKWAVKHSPAAFYGHARHHLRIHAFTGPSCELASTWPRRRSAYAGLRSALGIEGCKVAVGRAGAPRSH